MTASKGKREQKKEESAKEKAGEAIRNGKTVSETHSDKSLQSNVRLCATCCDNRMFLSFKASGGVKEKEIQTLQILTRSCK